MQLFFSIRVIGSKFRSVSNSSVDVSIMLKEFMEPINYKLFFANNGPRVFVDISWKYHPTDPLGSKKVAHQITF